MNITDNKENNGKTIVFVCNGEIYNFKELVV